MDEMNLNDSLFLIALVIIAVLFLVVSLIKVVFKFNGFSMELKYLNTEIGRTTGAERKHWLRRRRRLWLSLIPFVKY